MLPLSHVVLLAMMTDESSAPTAVPAEVASEQTAEEANLTQEYHLLDPARGPQAADRGGYEHLAQGAGRSV